MKTRGHNVELNYLADLRKRLHLSQRELAMRLQVPLAAISMAECGKRILPNHAVIKMARLEMDLLAQQPAENQVTEKGVSEIDRANKTVLPRIDEELHFSDLICSLNM